MGKLRVEPKTKAMDQDLYRDMLAILTEGRKKSSKAHVYFDLDPSDDAATLRKDLQYVAEKEGIALKIHRARGENTLRLEFDGNAATKLSRMNPAESRRRILEVMEKSNGTMQKSDILEEAGINPGAWNTRIRELIEAGKVTRSGMRRDTTYTLNR